MELTPILSSLTKGLGGREQPWESGGGVSRPKGPNCLLGAALTPYQQDKKGEEHPAPTVRAPVTQVSSVAVCFKDDGWAKAREGALDVGDQGVPREGPGFLCRVLETPLLGN